MRFVILLSVLLFAACKGDVPEPEEALPAFETNYVVMDEESHIRFTATQEGVAFDGEFKEFKAEIYFDPAALGDSHVRVTVPLSSFDGGNADRNSNVPGTVWFDTKNHPKALFETKSIRVDGDGYIASGTLTMKGFTQPILFPFTLENADGRAVMTARFPVTRARWKIGASPWDTAEYVGLEVSMDIQVTAERTE